MKPFDAGKRLHFCHWLSTFFHNCYSVLDYIFFSDEAWFHLSDYINAQNYSVVIHESSRVLGKPPPTESGVNVKAVTVDTLTSSPEIVMSLCPSESAKVDTDTAYPREN